MSCKNPKTTYRRIQRDNPSEDQRAILSRDQHPQGIKCVVLLVLFGRHSVYILDQGQPLGWQTAIKQGIKCTQKMKYDEAHVELQWMESSIRLFELLLWCNVDNAIVSQVITLEFDRNDPVVVKKTSTT